MYINTYLFIHKYVNIYTDFLTDLSTRIFDPSYGLFSLTSENLLYPNPAASLLYPGHGELEALYGFLGRVLGKALFENITIQSQFAHFFLAFMNGRYNFMNLINDLSTLDQELYKNLMFLKRYEGDIGDLCLTFSISGLNMNGFIHTYIFIDIYYYRHHYHHHHHHYLRHCYGYTD
jgi:ubiquitin-protein ligase E3 B